MQRFGKNVFWVLKFEFKISKETVSIQLINLIDER